MSDFEKLINASDLIEWIMETYPDWCVGAIRGIVDHINKLPSAQPATCWGCNCPKADHREEREVDMSRKGKWVPRPGGYICIYMCSECGAAGHRTAFCPHCGAQMTEEN